jgi:cell division septation protein DedD
MPTDTASAAPANLSLDLSDESATNSLFRAAIGPVGADHYLPVFTRFELADRAGSGWNWAACMCTLGWMLFRRLWGAALFYVGLLLVTALTVSAAMGMVFHAPEQVQLGVGLAMLLVAFVVPGVWGDAWLYAHCRKRMARALADSSSWAEAAILLDKEALTRPRAWWLAGAYLALLGAGAGAYLVLPDGLFPAPGRAPATDAARAPQQPLSAASGVASAAEPSASAAAPVSAPASAPITTTVPLQASTSAPAPAASLPVPVPAPVPVQAASTPAPDSALTPPSAAASWSTRAASGPVAQASDAAPSVSAPATLPSGKFIAVPSEAAGGPYLVNVGLFAVDTNARKAEAKLRGAGVKVMVQDLQTGNGKRTRVRAGPYGSKSQAEAAAEKIRALGLEAQVARQPAETGR